MPQHEVAPPATRSGWGWFAWALVLVVLLSWVMAAGAVPAGVARSAGPEGTTTAPGPFGDYPDESRHVVLVGVPGLTWDLVDEQRTPTLSGLAREGGAAALVVRGRHEVTCAADAWLTVGAGQRAGTDLWPCSPDEGLGGGTPGPGGHGDGSARSVQDVVTDGRVAPVAWSSWQEAAAGESMAPQLGSLAGLAEEAGTCVAAYGLDAVIGAALPDGTAALAVPAEPDTFPPGVAGAVGTASVAGADGQTICRIHLVSTPAVQESDRSDQLPAIDAALATLVEEVPDGTTVVVAGMGQTTGRAETQVLVISPVHVGDGAGGTLSSGTTRQRGLVQLTDLTPTLLAMAGVTPSPGDPSPDGAATPDATASPNRAVTPDATTSFDALAGEQVTVTPEVGDHVAQVKDLAEGISTAKWQLPYVLGTLLGFFLLLLAAAVVVRRRAGRHGIPVLAVVGTAALATPAAAFLAGLVPWWQASQPWPAGVGVILGGALLVTVLAWGGPWRRHPLGPPALVAAVTAVVLGVDAIWSARLGLVSVLGLQPVTAGRFYGQGNVGFGIMLGAVLVLMATVLATVRPRWSAATALVLLGLGATVLNASPGGGADFGGVPALVVATGLLTLTALGLRWSPLSIVVVLLVGGLVGAAAMVLDWSRGPEARTHLGGFVQAVIDGEALGIVGRKLDQSLGILVSYPVSWLAVLALVGVAVVAVRRPGWSAPLWRLPGMPSVALAALAAMVLAWALNDSGIAAVALTLTVLIATALSVLGRPRPVEPVG